MKHLYLVNYMQIKPDGRISSYGNMCVEMNIINTNVLDEMRNEILLNNTNQDRVWITDVIKLK